jgi:hypothetical protein
MDIAAMLRMRIAMAKDTAPSATAHLARPDASGSSPARSPRCGVQDDETNRYGAIR